MYRNLGDHRSKGAEIVLNISLNWWLRSFVVFMILNITANSSCYSRNDSLDKKSLCVAYTSALRLWNARLEKVTISGTRTRSRRPTDSFEFSISGQNLLSNYSLQELDEGDSGIVQELNCYSPIYCFRLVRTKGAPRFGVRSITPTPIYPTDIAKVRFYICLDLEIYAFSAIRIFDVPVSTVLDEDGWEIQEIVSGGDESASGIKVVAKCTDPNLYYDSAEFILSPSEDYGLRSYTLVYRDENGQKSTDFGTVQYATFSDRCFPANVKIHRVNQLSDGRVFESNLAVSFRTAEFKCDGAVFRLSNYGFPEPDFRPHTKWKYWFWILLIVGAGCCFLCWRFGSFGKKDLHGNSLKSGK